MVTFAVKLVSRSFDSLRSLRMTPLKDIQFEGLLCKADKHILIYPAVTISGTGGGRSAFGRKNPPDKVVRGILHNISSRNP